MEFHRAPRRISPLCPGSQAPAEFTARAVILGALFGILFGAVSVYVGLRAGLTVSASIPIAVLSISILRAFGRSTILENNIVQTTGSAGESVAAGVIFSIPALIFLGFSLNTEYWRIFFLALIGGWLGVLFMIPLRRQLIVKEHGNLTFPEGTACADVLVAGERGGSFAGRVFWGLGLGGVYTFLMNTMACGPASPIINRVGFPARRFAPPSLRNIWELATSLARAWRARFLPEALFPGWLSCQPSNSLARFLQIPLYPSTVPIPQMTPDQLWASYIRPMGAGAVAAAGLITLIKTLPTIFSALAAGLKDVRAKQAGISASRPHRTRPLDASCGGWLARDRRDDVGAPEIQAHSRRAEPARVQSDRRNLCGRLRISVRYGRIAHQRSDRQFIESRERDDHRHADGHLRHVSRCWAGPPIVRGSRADHRRRRLHRVGESAAQLPRISKPATWSAPRPRNSRSLCRSASWFRHSRLAAR